MATLRRLSIHEPSMYWAKAAVRSSPRVQVAAHHYWAGQVGKCYARSNIYTKDAYYNRWVAQRAARYTRSSSSWPNDRRRARLAREDAGKRLDSHHNDQTTSKNAKATQPQHDDGSWRKSLFGDERFFEMLKNDAETAYNYLHQQIEKDPYRWLFDPLETRRTWNPWGQAERNGQKDAAKQSTSTKPAPAPSTPDTDQPSFSVHNYMGKEEKFTIDPITLRKVAVEESVIDTNKQAEQYPRHQSPQSQSHTIPVAKFEAKIKTTNANPETTSNAPAGTEGPLAGFAAQPWLVKEGFAPAASPRNTDQQIRLHPFTPQARVPEPKDKLESSLSRLSKSEKVAKQILAYNPKEETKDDVDLLRASDIRATSGHIKRKTKPSYAEIEERTQVLDKYYQDTGKTYGEDLLAAYHQILEKRKARDIKQKAEPAVTDSPGLSQADFKRVKQHYDGLRVEINETAKILTQARKQVLHDSLTLETKAQQEVFDDFDTRYRKQSAVMSDIKENAKALQSSTASKENTERLHEKLQKLKRDAALVTEVKNIYEEQYGKITVDHKQPVSEESKVLETVPMTAKETMQTVKVNHNQPTVFNKILEQEAAALSPNLSARQALNSRIDELEIPDAHKRRLKFALRGVPELDAAVRERMLEPEETAPTDRVKAEALSAVSTITSPATTTDISSSNAISSPQESTTSAKKPEDFTYIYKILALDRVKDEIAIATTTSSIKHKSSAPRSAASLLVHLDQPSKYFEYMEQLDKEGYHLVSGSRTMLVYRRRTDLDGNVIPETDIPTKPSSASRGLKPLRQESVFSGHLQPKDRLLRSFQLAHRRTREQNSHQNSQQSSALDTEPETEQSRRQSAGKAFRRVAVTVLLTASVCYTIGLFQNVRAQQDMERGMRLREQEAAIRRAAEGKKNEGEWRWF